MIYSIPIMFSFINNSFTTAQANEFLSVYFELKYDF